MGSLCSKASTQTGGHQVLSSEAANSAPVDPAARRAALAAAADSRKKKVNMHAQTVTVRLMIDGLAPTNRIKLGEHYRPTTPRRFRNQVQRQ